MLLLKSFNYNVGDINIDINILLTIISGYCRYSISKFGVVYDSRKKIKTAKHSHRFCICQIMARRHDLACAVPCGQSHKAASGIYLAREMHCTRCVL